MRDHQLLLDSLSDGHSAAKICFDLCTDRLTSGICAWAGWPYLAGWSHCHTHRKEDFYLYVYCMGNFIEDGLIQL